MALESPIEPRAELEPAENKTFSAGMPAMDGEGG